MLVFAQYKISSAAFEASLIENPGPELRGTGPVSLEALAPELTALTAGGPGFLSSVAMGPQTMDKQIFTMAESKMQHRLMRHQCCYSLSIICS